MNRRQRRTQWQAAQRSSVDAALSCAPAFSAIRLRFGELVLRGFEKRAGSRIAAAFERSLSERLRSATLPAPFRQPMRSEQMRLAPMKVRHSTDAVAIGEDLARSVLALETGARRRGGLR